MTIIAVPVSATGAEQLIPADGNCSRDDRDRTGRLGWWGYLNLPAPGWWSD